MNIKDGDKLKDVKILMGEKDVVVYDNKGMGCRFSSSDVKDTSRLSIGVKAMDLLNDSKVAGIEIIGNNDKLLFIVTSRGYAKKCSLENFNTMNRTDKPLILIALDDSDALLLVKTVKPKTKFKAFMKESVEDIEHTDVMDLPRLGKGRKTIPVKKGEVIIDIKQVRE